MNKFREKVISAMWVVAFLMVLSLWFWMLATVTMDIMEQHRQQERTEEICLEDPDRLLCT